MRKPKFYQSHAWMEDELEEALEILQEVRENVESENGVPVDGYKRIWMRLGKALESAKGALGGIQGKEYPEDDVEEGV